MKIKFWHLFAFVFPVQAALAAPLDSCPANYSQELLAARIKPEHQIDVTKEDAFSMFSVGTPELATMSGVLAWKKAFVASRLFLAGALITLGNTHPENTSFILSIRPTSEHLDEDMNGLASNIEQAIVKTFEADEIVRTTGTMYEVHGGRCSESCVVDMRYLRSARSRFIPHGSYAVNRWAVLFEKPKYSKELLFGLIRSLGAIPGTDTGYWDGDLRMAFWNGVPCKILSPENK